MYTFEWDIKSGMVHRSRESAEILAIPLNQVQHTKKELLERIHPEDRQDYLKVITSLTFENPSYRAVFRVMCPNDGLMWLEESGRAFFAQDGTMERVIGIVTDVTEARQSEKALRELSGRLITSQEEERRRIVRELHDNIGQELAVLAVQAQRIDSGASEQEQTMRLDIHDLYKHVKDIALKVSTLSHRLHSSELDFLGLGVATERLCRDFGNQHGIDVDEEISDLPRRVDTDVSQCFYRILQEALHNVAKHSRATRVEVKLEGCKNQLTLSVKDNGQGFDAEKVRFESGLGIVSMRERMRLVGGQIAIHSKMGQGTEVRAWVAVTPPSTYG
jgi:signal transduction histidine kinase